MTSLSINRKPKKHLKSSSALDRLLNQQVEQLPVGLLKPYPGNARTHSKKQVRQIAASIKTFGFNVPILIDEAHMVLAGHGRLEAARQLGLEMVPVLRVAHLSEAEKRAFILADNKIAQNAAWDPQQLAIEFQSLIELEPIFELTVTGFETGEIDHAIQIIDGADDQDSASDLVHPDPALAVSHVGAT